LEVGSNVKASSGSFATLVVPSFGTAALDVTGAMSAATGTIYDSLEVGSILATSASFSSYIFAPTVLTTFMNVSSVSAASSTVYGVLEVGLAMTALSATFLTSVAASSGTVYGALEIGSNVKATSGSFASLSVPNFETTLLDVTDAVRAASGTIYNAMHVGGSVTASSASFSSLDVATLAAPVLDATSYVTAGAGTVYGHLSVGQNLTAASASLISLYASGFMSSSQATVSGAVAAGSATVHGALHLGGAISANGGVNLVAGQGIACLDYPTNRLEVCDSSDGNRGPSIDAEELGSTKFHVGGVLKVKVGDDGLHIYGNSTFDGDAIFNARVSFHGEVKAFESSSTTWEGEFSHSNRLTLKENATIDVLSSKFDFQVPYRMGTSVGVVNSSQAVEIHSVSGRILSTDTLNANTPVTIDLFNHFITGSEIIIVTADTCQCDVSPCLPISVNTGTPGDGVVPVTFSASQSCSNPAFSFFLVRTTEQRIQ